MLSRLTLIKLENVIKITRMLGPETMNQVVGITHNFSRNFLSQPLQRLVFHPPRTCIIRRVGNHILCLSPNYGKNYLGECFEGMEGLFGYSKSGHRFPSRLVQVGSNGLAYSTT